MIKVREFPPIYPPRPSGAINPATVSSYKGFIAQYKYNDIRVLIYFYPDGRIELMSRKREPLLSFQLDAHYLHSLSRLKLRRGGFHLLDGGVMRQALGSGQRKVIVLWDILIHDSEYLLGTTYRERYARLCKLAGNPKALETDSGNSLGLALAPHLWLAQVFEKDFSQRFESTLSHDELEGLVLKNPGGKLQWGLTEENNGGWQIRVRKTSGRHVF